MATKRIAIRNKLAALLKTELDGSTYTSNCFETVETRQVFWDELTSFPALAVVNGRETTTYLPASFTWKYLNILIKVFVKEDDEGVQLEQFLQDIESILDANNSLTYEVGKTTELISIVCCDTDEGLLYPYGVGEISIIVQYDNNMY